MSKKVVSGLLLALIMLSMLSACVSSQNQLLNGNALWIEPSVTHLSQYEPEQRIGYRFNVTVCIRLDIECGAWQFRMLYDKAQLNATRCGYTAGLKSQFFENISTIPTPPAYAPLNSTHNRVDFAESWAGSGPFRSPGEGTLAWLEFEVLAEPHGEMLESWLDISTFAQWPDPRTYVIVGPSRTKIVIPAYNSLYQFLPDTIPPALNVLSPQNLTYTVSSIPLSFTLNESASWKGYELDGQENVTIAGNTTLSGLSNGQHSLTVFANDTFGNMGASSTISFASNVGVDLSVVSPDIVFSDENPTGGETVTISATVYNTGGQSADNVTVRFLDGNSSIGEQQISSISYNSHVAVSVDWTAVGEGYHLMKVSVDPCNLINETDENNNVATRSLPVGEIPSYGAIIVTINANPNVTYAGATVNVFGNAVYNTTYGAGEAVAGADVTITIVGVSEDKMHTTADGSYTKGITAPYGPGSYTIVVTVSDHTFSASNETSLQVLQQEGVDLTVASRDISFVPPDPIDHDTVNVTARIHNVGTQEAQNILVAFYCDGNPIENSTISAIAGGDSKAASILWNATPYGGHQIKVVVDPEDNIAELDENNNVAFAGIYVYPAASDLTPTSISFSDSSPLVDQGITVCTYVRNIGGIGASSVLVSFFDDDQPIGNKTIGWIAGKGAGATTSISHQLATSGWHTILVVVDLGNSIFEADEGNNNYSVRIFAHESRPDLTLSSGDISFSNSTPAVGDNVTVSATIHNIGEQGAQNATVDFSEGGFPIGSTIIIPSVSAGGQATVSVLWNVSAEEWHTIGVVIDRNDSVEESNENNNQASRSIYVPSSKAADLCIVNEDIVFSDTVPISGEEVEIYATVHNIGEALALDVTVRFYVDEVQQGLPETISSIPVGGDSTVSREWVASGLGAHVVKVLVDTARESDKSNNNATRGIIVGQHSVAVSSLEIGKHIVGLNFTMNITVCVQNLGYYPETFHVRIHANNTIIGVLNITALGDFNSTSITYVWSTEGFAYGNYTIWAEADIVLHETDTGDNTCIDGSVHVGVPGDVGGDHYVGIDDIFDIACHYGEDPGSTGWDGKYDITNDGFIGVDDIYIAAQHFGQEEP